MIRCSGPGLRLVARLRRVWVWCRLVCFLPRLRLFPAVLRLCVRSLLVVGVLAWGLGRVFVIGARGLVLVAGWCLVVVWLLVGGRGLWGVCALWFLVLA